MAVIGYGRVSTVEQTLDLQRDAFHAAGAACIYEDKASGKTADRPELVHCLKALRHGDALVVWRLGQHEPKLTGRYNSALRHGPDAGANQWQRQDIALKQEKGVAIKWRFSFSATRF